jgi:hypothetical protein
MAYSPELRCLVLITITARTVYEDFEPMSIIRYCFCGNKWPMPESIKHYSLPKMLKMNIPATVITVPLEEDALHKTIPHYYRASGGAAPLFFR